MNGDDARELLSCALDRIERYIELADPDRGRLVVDVRLWPTPLIAAVVKILRRQGKTVRKTARQNDLGQVGPALEIVLPAATQLEISFG